ncbi:uncharacterized protein [Cardiocondyla obscurior]|uniref:uncharacterized protein n=1 Tax=Cardiocondyla obscurior TaxID=286306 RepID=UPI0039656164
MTIRPDEIKAALTIMVRCVQRGEFADEYASLAEGRALPRSSHILSLTPFIDEVGVIRVGGRLRNSEIPYEARHPMLLPRNSELTKRIIRKHHIDALHSGVQGTLAAVRQRFWPIAATSAVRGVIRDCIKYFKYKPIASKTRMADMPGSRVTIARPFTHTGVDYAGPIMIKEGKRRNARLTKAYIAIFVCLTVKAMHIELVTDLTTEAFLGAFKRFIARRGKPNCIYSDNGTTFVGAKRELKELREFINHDQTRALTREFLCKREIEWKFIPPHAPHFGGLWEAAVKSVKKHMYKIVGHASLTYEELCTLFYEIEANLNSRPLAPLSTDPNDLSCITPGHFLVGAALCSFPVADLQDIAETRLSRWQRVERIRQHFWTRWSQEYLHILTQRSKWREQKGPAIQEGQLVLVQQPGLEPMMWTLGRVIQTHPRPEGIVRAATLKTRGGTVTRPTVKLAVLPFEGNT